MILESATKRLKEISGQYTLLDRISAGINVAAQVDLSKHLENCVELSVNEIFIKTRNAFHPDLVKYLSTIGWEVDKKRRGISFKLPYVKQVKTPIHHHSLPICSNNGVTTKTDKELEGVAEPTEKEIYAYMKTHPENYYNARERLREKAYGGKPPHGFQSWGDYWKSY